VALPDDIDLTPPARGTDYELTVLAGAWEGTWDNKVPARYYVEEIGEEYAQVVSGWGALPTAGVQSGWSRREWTVLPRGAITIGDGTPSDARVTLMLSADASMMIGTSERDGVRPMKITLTRCSL
jgi:hypothetical protein